MKKILILLVSSWISIYGFSQQKDGSTNQFSVIGLIDKPLVITYSDLEKEKITDIGDFKVTNHLGEFRKEYKNVKAVKLLNLLNRVNISSSSPKLLSEYYLIFKASDGYAVVASWNEIFNTVIGETFYLIVEADNKSLKNTSESILLISAKDFKTGRRHVKGLQSIEIKKI